MRVPGYICKPEFHDYWKDVLKALEKRDFLLTELKRLEQLGVVYSKKLRLVVDASRALNPFIEDQKVKLEDLSVAEMTMSEGDWQVKTDMDSGLGLHQDYKKYVGLHYVHNDGSISFWVYNTLFLVLRVQFGFFPRC